MKHAYLTKEEIDTSYRYGMITVQEMRELLSELNQCAIRAIALLQSSEIHRK